MAEWDRLKDADKEVDDLDKESEFARFRDVYADTEESLVRWCHSGLNESVFGAIIARIGFKK